MADLHREQLPPVTAPTLRARTDTEPTDILTQPFSDDIIDSLSQGAHHKGTSLPVEQPMFPYKEVLVEALNEVNAYLQQTGCYLLADSHLEGRAAVIHQSDSGVITAYIEEQLLVDLVTSIIKHTTNTTLASLSEDDKETVIETVLLAHTFQSNAVCKREGITAESAADWASYTGDNTTSRAEVLFTVPHPMELLDSHSIIPERALAMIGGVQRLNAVCDFRFAQEDLAAVYLHSYLTGYGVGDREAKRELSRWYDTTVENIVATQQSLRELTGDISVLSSDFRPESYYLSPPAADAFTENYM